jgi:hypothetical protein
MAACAAVVGMNRFLEIDPVQWLIVTELAILLSGGMADDRLADKGDNGKEEQPDHRKDALPGCTSFHLP